MFETLMTPDLEIGPMIEVDVAAPAGSMMPLSPLPPTTAPLSEETVARFQAAMEKPLADNALLQRTLETFVIEKPIISETKTPVVPEMSIVKPAIVAQDAPTPVVKPTVAIVESPNAPVVPEAPETPATPVIPEAPIVKPAIVAQDAPTSVIKPTVVIVESPNAPVVPDAPATPVIPEAPIVKQTVVAQDAPTPVIKPTVVIVEAPNASVVPNAPVVPDAPATSIKKQAVVTAMPTEKPVFEEHAQKKPDEVVVAALPQGVVPEAILRPIEIKPIEVQPVVSASVVAKVEAVSAAEVLVQAATAVADTMLVSPGLMRGEGEIVVQLKPEVLGGTELKVSVQAGTMTVEFTPTVEKIATLLIQNQGQLVEVLTERVAAYNIVVNVRPAHQKGMRYARA